MNSFKIMLAALLVFALVPLFPNGALASAGQSDPIAKASYNSNAFTAAPRDSNTTAASTGAYSANPAPVRTLKQPPSAKTNRPKTYAKTADGVELLHGTFAFTTGTALIIASVALENRRR